MLSKRIFLQEAINILCPEADKLVPKIINMTLGELLDIISKGGYSLNRDYNLSSEKTNELIKCLVPNNSKKGVKLCTNIAQSVGFKWCPSCNTYKPLEDFNLNPSKSLGVNNYCSVCHTASITKTQPARTARYKSNKLKRTPCWLTKEEINSIRDFYRYCPEGYEVDHIIPLQGVNVSGLHCFNNLQYLKKADNASKNNKYVIE